MCAIRCARVDDDGSYKLDTEIVKLDNGDTQLWVNGIYPAVYASAIDDRRWCTRADVDLDDEVTVVDATHIQRHLADMEEFDDLQKITSDVDGDGETTIVDSSWIQRFLASQMVPYAIGEMMEITEE
ncbi:dockerin type I repeat-containing protein [Ruminococcus sp.]|uniref:dockerin type I repeat-containing protein n=1 Tax=Ruminococcus sp. TaxID=41978 RepID=UPI0038693C05